MRRLSELTEGVRRLALVGLAKNTGKTEALAALLREHSSATDGRPARAVGVTSIGRDGEERDVIDARIAKPRVRLAAGDLVATTGALLRASGVAHERLLQSGVRTPLGEVLLARLLEPGTVEVAGPSAAADVRAVSDGMLERGAEQVVIDGAIDRRAASSPRVSDGLVMATGAVLAEEIEQVVAATAAAVELVRLPLAVDDGDGALPVPRALALRANPDQIATLLREYPHVEVLVLEGALSERFLDGLLAARQERVGRELRVVAADPTRVFLSRRTPGWYRRQGVAIEVSRPIELVAITVNPVAPQSHSFDSQRLRELIEEAVEGLPVLDVLDPVYVELASAGRSG